MGFRGRSAIHPRQLPVIAAAFAPTETELRWARTVLSRLGGATGEQAGESADAPLGVGVGVLDDGSMVDAAMARRARAILDAS